MAAGQRKYDVAQIRFNKSSQGISATAEFTWGIEEVGGQVLDRRGNHVDLSKEDLQAILTAPQRQALQDVFAAIKTAVKAKAAELATAAEE